jgi:alkylation response protein AidB-like acyl-CoA dehydrogenase
MLSRSRIAKVFAADVAVMVTNKALELMGFYAVRAALAKSVADVAEFPASQTLTDEGAPLFCSTGFEPKSGPLR